MPHSPLKKNFQTSAVVMVYAFREAFQLFNFGYIAAFAVVIFFMLFGATLGSLRFSGLVREEAR